MSEDGLATWNYFDAGVKKGQAFPVLRLKKDGSLADARQNIEIVHDATRQTGGRLGMLMAWGWNIRFQGVYDDEGNLTFTTIFPACYAGRWPHMHFEVYESLVQTVRGTGYRFSTKG